MKLEKIKTTNKCNQMKPKTQLKKKERKKKDGLLLVEFFLYSKAFLM